MIKKKANPASLSKNSEVKSRRFGEIEKSEGKKRCVKVLRFISCLRKSIDVEYF